jgi:hypothetical protein
VETEIIKRPDGRAYKPRKVIAYLLGEDYEGVIVLGIHDIARAQVLADALVRTGVDPGYVAVKPETGWWREGYESGQLRWISDEMRGRAGVLFRDLTENSSRA